MATSLDQTARQAALDAVVDLLDGGTVDIMTGTAADPDATVTETVLATISLSTPAFGAASAGVSSAVATCNGVPLEDATPANAGTAAHFVAKQSGGNVLLTGTVGVGTGDMQLNSTSIATDVPVSITAWTITLAQAQS